MDYTYKAKAPAKVNLYLNIVGVRKDGYHEIRTIFQSLRLCDEIYFEPQAKGIKIECDNIEIPQDDSNLAYLSAKEFFKYSKINKGVKIKIKKNIPIKAGLGGGSSDAAVTLFVLNKIFKVNIPLYELIKIGANIGSDVPFFLIGGTALGTGRGEEVFPLKDIKRFYLLLGLPEMGVSTKDAYKKIDKVLTEKNTSLKIVEIVRKILAGEFGKEDMFNRFEEVIKEKKILEYKKKLYQSKTEKILLCGSGSALFGIFAGKKEAMKNLKKLSVQGNWAVTSTLNRREYFNFITPTTLKKESFK